MTGFRGLALRNTVILVNFLLALISLGIDETVSRVLFFNFHTGARLIGETIGPKFVFLFLASQVLVGGAIFVYELPVRRMIRLRDRDGPDPVEAALAQKAKRRLLNQPFIVIVFNVLAWLGVAILMLGLAHRLGASAANLRPVVADAVRTFVLTSTITFFVIQLCVQNLLIPRLFPEGRLQNVPGAWPVKLWLRLGLVVLAAGVIPLVLIGELAYRASISVMPPDELLQTVVDGLMIIVPLFLTLGVVVAVIFALNISRSLNHLAKVLTQVSKGRFDVAAAVKSNDEIGYVSESVNDMIKGLQERELIKDAFGKYVADDVRDEVLSGRIPLDGERREVSVLFADLRDFTPMTEANDPKLVVKVMNRYFEKMEEAVHEQGGLVLQYLGDEIYAVFGAPVDRADHAARAFKAGRTMMNRLAELNKNLLAEGLPPLAHGIGIHSGEVVAANIGSPNRLSYLLVGDTVNLAARLQALNKELSTQMLISGQTRRFLAQDDVADAYLEELPPTKVKGRSEAVSLFSVG